MTDFNTPVSSSIAKAPKTFWAFLADKLYKKCDLNHSCGMSLYKPDVNCARDDPNRLLRFNLRIRHGGHYLNDLQAHWPHLSGIWSRTSLQIPYIFRQFFLEIALWCNCKLTQRISCCQSLAGFAGVCARKRISSGWIRIFRYSTRASDTDLGDLPSHQWQQFVRITHRKCWADDRTDSKGQLSTRNLIRLNVIKLWLRRLLSLSIALALSRQDRHAKYAASSLACSAIFPPRRIYFSILLHPLPESMFSGKYGDVSIIFCAIKPCASTLWISPFLFGMTMARLIFFQRAIATSVLAHEQFSG